MMNESKVVLEFTKAEALVLFEFVSRFTDQNQLSIEDQAEQIVLWHVQGMLEPKIDELFSRNYDKVVQRAWAEVRDQIE